MTYEPETDLRSRLTPLQFKVTQQAGTERAFSGEYWDSKDPGTYRCIVCDAELFSSETKYDSGSGWPSFWDVIQEGNVELRRDTSHGMVRTEVVCSRCESHLGHMFEDGPRDQTGLRYCINSASLNFDAEDK